jgi:hypothetical protein
MAMAKLTQPRVRRGAEGEMLASSLPPLAC